MVDGPLRSFPVARHNSTPVGGRLSKLGSNPEEKLKKRLTISYLVRADAKSDAALGRYAEVDISQGCYDRKSSVSHTV
jgi:hypothetical protein